MDDPFSPSISGLFLNDTDQLPIFSLILDNNSIGVKGKYITFHEKNAPNLSSFKEDLAKINWTKMPGLNDPSCAYEIFAEKYISIYEKCFPLKRMKGNVSNFSLNPLRRKICYISVSLITLLH